MTLPPGPPVKSVAKKWSRYRSERTQSRIVRDAGRAVAEMGERRRHIRRGRSARAGDGPQLFGVEGAAVALLDRRRMVVGAVIAVPPAALAALRDVDPAGLIARVGVVVVGEEIAGVVESELLRIAQTAVDQFQMRPVELAAEDGSALGVGDRRSFLGLDVESAVADREVEPAVGPDPQAMEIMARVLDYECRSRSREPTIVGDAGPLRVAEERRCSGCRRRKTLSLYVEDARAAMPSAGSLKPLANSVLLSAMPEPVESQTRWIRSSNFSKPSYGLCPGYVFL